MSYCVVVIWFFVSGTWPGLLEKFGKVGLTSLALCLVLGVYSYSHSVDIVEALDIDSELSQKEDRLRIGTFNKLYTNDRFTEDSEDLISTNVDVMAFEEINEAELEFVSDQLNHQFTYITDCDCSAGTTEVAVSSRYPIINAQTIYEHDHSVIARTLIASEEHGEFVVYAVHMFVPYIIESYGLRADTYELLSDAIDAETLPTFAMGDFNTAVYSPDMQNFMRDTKRVQNVVDRSWPKCTWFGTQLRDIACARIDFVFAPVGSVAYAIKIGSGTHSDHRSVIVEVGL